MKAQVQNSMDEQFISDDHPVMHYFSASFQKEWDGTVEVPYLDSLLHPDEPLHIKHTLVLDTDTPYGNLQLSWIELLCDISAINVVISKTNSDHAELRQQLSRPDVVDAQGLYLKQRVNAEDLSQKLKTLVDRFIMLVALVDHKHREGEYPDKIHPDSIGSFLKIPKKCFAGGKLDGYRPVLKRLNTVANAQKHTFLNLQTSIILNRQTPGVVVFYQQNNKNQSGMLFEYLIFVNLIRELNNFSVDVKTFLKSNR